ncbi:hypothetical protein OsJ_33457 [Oryza sativa Japonica Group]|uniref:Uncharacterized protein n=1 Tax=Oryza sativa subsp. japonica TaxID=39947 RepID=A3C9Z9_ORYSJ|nr:hypothetical protein OsJ_33457 [Oryza sativa Japonica Group]
MAGHWVCYSASTPLLGPPQRRERYSTRSAFLQRQRGLDNAEVTLLPPSAARGSVVWSPMAPFLLPQRYGDRLQRHGGHPSSHDGEHSVANGIPVPPLSSRTTSHTQAWPPWRRKDLRRAAAQARRDRATRTSERRKRTVDRADLAHVVGPKESRQITSRTSAEALPCNQKQT